MGIETIRRMEKDALEIWRPVIGYEGLYEVSSYGRVRGLDRFDGRNKITGKILSVNYEKNGYCSVALSKYGNMKRHKIHRLVAQAFIPNPDNLPQVNHKDENKENNRVENLEWCTAKYNINYGNRLVKLLNTKIEKGMVDPDMVGLDRKDYMKKWKERNSDYMVNYMKEYYKCNKDKWK